MGLGHLPTDPEELGPYLLRGPELIHVLGNMREAVKLADDWGLDPRRMLHVSSPKHLRGVRGGLFLETPGWALVNSFGPAREIAAHLNMIEAVGRANSRGIVTEDGFRVLRIKLVEPESMRRIRLDRRPR